MADHRSSIAARPVEVRTLVVDDEDEVREFCTRLLTRLGHHTTPARSAQEALAALRSDPYDLLVTDVSMPGMTGVELIAAARQVRPDLPAVVITGYGTIEVATDALRAGANDFVVKPFGVLDLRDACDRALAQAALVAEHGRLKALFPLFQLARRDPPATPQQLAADILEVVTQDVRADGVALYVSPARDQAPVALAQRGLVPQPLPPVEAYEPLLAPEAASVPSEAPAEALPEAWREAGIGRALCVPLTAPGRRVGLLAALRGAGREAFGRGDGELLMVLASQAAAALETLRLTREQAAWNRELEHRVEARTAELLQAKDALLRAQRLAVIGELGASVAHEMRTPLGVISNSVYYLRQRLAPQGDAKVLKHLEIIEREVEASNSVITGLMGLVRTPNPRTQAIEPRALVERCLERAALPESVRVTVSDPGGLPCVLADPEQIGLAFSNIVANAVQAMPDGGVLHVTLGADDGRATFCWEDTGAGIAPEHLERVFDPLFTTKARGIGLGLAIVRRLVEAHGGEVQVASTPGAGARFTVSLPVAS